MHSEADARVFWLSGSEKEPSLFKVILDNEESANDPASVAKKHDQLTRENGPYMANGSMRTLRAIYNQSAAGLSVWLGAGACQDEVDAGDELLAIIMPA